jgi:hypothetical protein
MAPKIKLPKNQNLSRRKKEADQNQKEKIQNLSLNRNLRQKRQKLKKA